MKFSMNPLLSTFLSDLILVPLISQSQYMEKHKLRIIRVSWSSRMRDALTTELLDTLCSATMNYGLFSAINFHRSTKYYITFD